MWLQIFFSDHLSGLIYSCYNIHAIENKCLQEFPTLQVEISKIGHNPCKPKPKFRPCSPSLLSSTSMLVWSGFFMVWLWISCFHHPLRTRMLYFECDPEKLLKQKISSTFQHLLFRILKGFKTFSDRQLANELWVDSIIIWWEWKLGWEVQV